ncbi:MAG TPA: alpha/beta hydrolase [Streptosporangiaceae bacterium]|nr:alpha/beta hydrolase [Streptosporangiaceae bacterium]
MDDRSRRPGEEQPPQSRWANLDGPVHYVDYGGPDSGPLLVLVHGLGGSLVSWAAIAPALARTTRVLAIDLAGFGRTRGSGLSASLPANRDLLQRFLTQVAGRPAVLVGHSMGGTIAVMQASENPETVSGLVLISPVVPWVRDELERRLGSAIATVSQTIRPADPPGRRRPGAPEQTARAATHLSSAHQSRISARLISQYFAVARERGWGQSPRTELITAGRSLTWTLLHRRQFAVMLSGVQTPVLWLHGDRDPLIPVGVARDAVTGKPTWSFQAARDIGHEPHREAPAWTAERIEAWLNAGAAGAADQAPRASRPDGTPDRSRDA